MTRVEVIRAYLEQTDPWLGNWTRERTEGDIRMMWELLHEVERLQELVDYAIECAEWCDVPDKDKLRGKEPLDDA